MFTDTHTHLYEAQLLADELQIERALASGVTHMFMPNCDPETVAPMLQLADRYPDHCFPMMGLHPTYVKADFEEQLSAIRQWLGLRRFYAIGEIGLDYYWDLTYKEQQQQAFAAQIDWALELDLPIVIHSRESTSDCIDMVAAKQNGRLKGIFHCFSGTIQEAEAIIDLGFYLGIGGVVTYKKSTLPEVLAAVSLNHIVLETDAPYLAPVPHRGKRNESSFIPLIAQKIAEIKNTTIEEVAIQTTANAASIFGV